jgi:NADH-quinone oxidoreductase subunit M
VGFELSDFLLTAVVFLPACVALVLVASAIALEIVGLPALPESLWRSAGLAAAFGTLGLMIFGVAAGFDPEQLGLQQVESFAQSETFGAKLLFGIDGIGLLFMLSTTALVPLAMLSSRGEVKESVRAWVLVCLLLESALLGALASVNLLAFIFFWAVSLIPVLLWMGHWGGAGRSRAAARIWAIESMGFASLLFVVFVLHESTLEQFGAPLFDLIVPGSRAENSLLDVSISVEDQWPLFLAMALGLATRLPIVPFHFWLPAAHASAPTGLSVLLTTGYVQAAALGLMRFALPLFPDAAVAAGPALSVLGIFALVYASLIALVQKELKRLIAYAWVGYAGFALFGLSTLNVQGLTGAVLQLLTHGLAASGLFVLTGFLAARRGTTEVAAFGGLAKPMPVCAFFFAIMVLSLMGLPLLGGFVGDLFVLLGSLETRRELSVIALLAMVVAASYLLWVQRRLFLGPVDEPANRGLIDLDWTERGVLLAMTIPIIAIGVYPNPLLRRIEPTVLEILYQMERRSVAEEIRVPEAESEVVDRPDRQSVSMLALDWVDPRLSGSSSPREAGR